MAGMPLVGTLCVGLYAAYLGAKNWSQAITAAEQQAVVERLLNGLLAKRNATQRNAADRIDAAPVRRAFPRQWKLDLQQPLRGRVIFIRRTNDKGEVELRGHKVHVDSNWVHRLVRAEVDLTAEQIRIFALRRREPVQQPQLKAVAYQTPRRRFIE
jgi:hypothetical protein